MMTEKAYGKHIKGNQPPKGFKKQLKEVEIVLDPSHFRSLSEQVAQHRLYEKNKIFHDLKEAFPAKWTMWHVDRYFPYAKGGPLAVDEPNHPADVVESFEKQKLLLSKGIRMVVLTYGITLNQALEQLYGAEQCLGQHQTKNSDSF